MRGPYVILSPITKSHPFDERKAKVGPDDDPLKIGRAVARLKPSHDNAIFDCKVLSRNHAIMWYSNGGFYLRDTRSSNGTFVNNERLAVTGEESEARRIYTRDIVQFGVEIVENTNKVAHGCIYASIQLFDADGEIVENLATLSNGANSSQEVLSSSLLNSYQLFQLQQYVSEAAYREEATQKKLKELESLLCSTEVLMSSAQKAVVNEDRLLSRIETLEAQLSVYSKTPVDKIKEEMLTLIEDKAKFEAMCKDSLRRTQEERVEYELRLSDIDRSLVTTEEECVRLRDKLVVTEKELRETVRAFDNLQHEHSMAKSAMDEMERHYFNTKEELRAAEALADEALVERAFPILVDHLQESIRNDKHLGHEESLSYLIELLKYNVGVQESVPEPPCPNEEEAVPERKIKEEETEGMNEKSAVEAQMEATLKENLALQVRNKELEAQLFLFEKEPQKLEFVNAKSISSFNSDRPRLLEDVLIPSVLLFSLAPLLAAFLCIFVPLHRRFLEPKKLE
ncbi:unnamed protein product [Auanema sp. JU1783]|nr:unnamed protein product [Auanema sp. JU1783]